MMVSADGRLELPDRLADWLGLSPPPRYLDDLAGRDGGLTPEDARALAADVAAAQKAGADLFARAIRARGSSRGADDQGSCVRRATCRRRAAWCCGSSTRPKARRRSRRLGEERAEALAAFDALTGLIEAAPMPMWYRGPDLRLVMVNSAYVDAVEAPDARRCDPARCRAGRGIGRRRPAGERRRRARHRQAADADHAGDDPHDAAHAARL